MNGRVFSRRLFLLAALLPCVLAALLPTTGCSSASPVPTTQTPSSRFALDQPVDVILRTAAPWAWDAVVEGDTVAFVESDSYGFPDLGQPQARQQGTVKTLDLETGEVSAVPGGELSSPAALSFWPWWLLAELPGAGSGTEAGTSLLWAVRNALSGNEGIMHLTGWTAAAGTKAVLNSETVTLPPIRTGDILALPLTSPAFESEHGGAAGSTLGETLLVVTPGLEQPIAVDPDAPVLPAAALEGLSPYVSWSGWLLGRVPPTQYAARFRGDLPGQPPCVYDLRSGTLVDIVVKEPRTPDDWLASVVAGHWAAWVAIEDNYQAFSLYLADLSTGQAQRLGDAPARLLALSEDWLLWTDASGDLLGYHLPDLTPVRVAAVLASDEQLRNIQVTGDLAVLMVVDQEANTIGPDFPPRSTAVRVVRLR
jgi:hypothetical protein